MQSFKKVDWKDVLIRCAKTFVQAAIPLILASVTAIDFSGDGSTIKSVLVAALLSAIATGICAVWNGVINPLLDGVKTISEEKSEAKQEEPKDEEPKDDDKK